LSPPLLTSSLRSTSKFQMELLLEGFLLDNNWR
jgi:hypothetical protein